ncbi:MAG: sulfatase-like hydrolase/transferase [Gammaproteobacteria bacterium]|nr:sulfatase-like hydrolase/transferase [Gammaproteobacteria bacterium]
MLRSTGLITICILLVAACSQSDPSNISTKDRSQLETRPNILFIVADDLGYTDIGAFGSEIPTPNLDNLAFQGVRLTSLHAARACQETRVMMMASSGVSAALEVRPRLSSGERGNRLSLDWAILPELLQDAGYATYMTGKWDLGLEAGYTPATRGFDRSFVQLGASASHFAEILWGEESLYELDGERVAYTELPDDFYSTNYYTDRMLEFIQSNNDSPWFAYVPLTTPHWPLQVPEDWVNRHAGKYNSGYDSLRESRMTRADELGVIPTGVTIDNHEQISTPWIELTEANQLQYARSQEIYAAMVENMDLNVGRLIKSLEESEQLSNTVIMFSSDHGGSAAEHGQRPPFPGQGGPRPPDFINNQFENWGHPNSFIDHGLGFAEAATAPLKGHKGRLKEGGLRAAAFIYYPKKLPQGSVNESFITMMDIMPTFLEISGIEHPGATNYKGRQINPIVGRSFWPHLTGRSETVHLPTDTAGWAQNDIGALIKGDYKIINEPFHQETSDENTENSWRLYNINNDPGERNNLAQQEPELVLELIEEWETNWR